MPDLTPEERQRIYLEEKARLEIRKELEGPKTSVGRGIGIVVLCGVGLLVVLFVIGSIMERSESSSSSGVGTIRATYWCADNFDAAGQIGLAANRGDTAAIAGMLVRGRAFQVEGGTRVKTSSVVDMGISLVFVESGFQVGRKCYIPTKALF